MIEIKYCGVCGDELVVEKLEKELSKLEDVEKTECGNCKLEITADNKEIFNEEKNILDFNRVFESAKTALS